MEYRYDIEVESPLGQRRGTLEWDVSGEEAVGHVTLLGQENPARGQFADDALTLRHDLRTAVSTLHCTTEAALRGDSLQGTIRCLGGRMRLHGTKIQERNPNE